MSNASLIIIILLCFVIILSSYIIKLKNTLINSQNKVLNKFTTIDKELDKELSLLPDLSKFLESKIKDSTIKEVKDLVSKYYLVNSINDKIEYNHTLSNVLNKLFTLIENYPEIKNNSSYQELAKSISTHKDKIEYAISFYNSEGEKFNTLIATFPYNIIAKLSKYEKYLIYEDN